MQALDELKQLIFSGGFDEESRADVLAMEKRLQDLAVKEKLAEQPVFKEYIDWLQAEYDNCNLLLQSDPKLTDRERDALFERKKICDQFLSVFTGKQRAGAESAIREALELAKSR